ncbi:GNAT family N-acetyltransferase [Thiomicrorhabdus sp.]|nr:GNAT family N-acetyltransferase [Thiomicrorhabdus sp.]
MVIRPAETSDTEKIAATHKASIETICSNFYNSQSIAGWVEILSPAIYEDAIENKVMILAEENEEILGIGILDLAEGEIGAIYIHPKAKGKGYGRKLLLELESIALKNNVTQLALCSTMNALGFYQHHGYIGTDKTFHELPNGIKLECIKMSKNLKKQ